MQQTTPTFSGKDNTTKKSSTYHQDPVISEANEKSSPYVNYNWQDQDILIVEDDYSSYRFLEAIISKTSARIHHAVDGKRAIDFCKKNPSVDLVLMDIQLPIMDGYKATKEIKKLRKNLPVIAQTAHALEEDKSKSLKAGCDDYIAKPINKNNLLNIINKYL